MAQAAMNIDGGAVRQVSPSSQKVTRETPRWLFFAGDFPGEKQKPDCPAGGIDFGSNCIVPFSSKPGYMHRCLITPILRTTHQLFKQETPVGVTMVETMPGYNPLNGQRTDMVHVFLYPGEEWDWLKRQYAGWGLTDIETLVGKYPAEVEPLKLNSLIFPEWPNLPPTNKGVLEHLQSRKTFFNKSEHKAVYHAVIDELLEATNKTQRWMKQHVDAVHSAFRLSEKDSHKRSHYDLTDLHFIEMAGLQRVDEAAATTANSQAAMVSLMAQQAQGMNAETFMTALKAVLEQNAETVKEALSQRDFPRERKDEPQA